MERLLRGEKRSAERSFKERLSPWREQPRRERLHGETLRGEDGSGESLVSFNSHLYATHSVGLLPPAVYSCICAIWLVPAYVMFYGYQDFELI